MTQGLPAGPVGPTDGAPLVPPDDTGEAIGLTPGGLTLTFGFGGWAWGITLITFFVTSSALSHFRRAQKQRLAGEKFEKTGRRDLAQTLANGGIGAVLALAYGLSGQPLVLLVVFGGVMATVTADTWATEIGVLSPQPPRLLTTWRCVAA